MNNEELAKRAMGMNPSCKGNVRRVKIFRMAYGCATKALGSKAFTLEHSKKDDFSGAIIIDGKLRDCFCKIDREEIPQGLEVIPTNVLKLKGKFPDIISVAKKIGELHRQQAA